MAGKPYTMREMRGIVEYLTERKAYAEIRGRKMWMEFANSDKTERTWQSLKETFLKRILPDIMNPYYNLSRDQINSFKQGYDVAEREKSNRLAFRAASGDSAESQNNLKTANLKNGVQTSSNEQAVKTGIFELPGPSIGKALEKATGEKVTAAEIPSSADTLVLEYENAEDILRDLESPTQNINNDKKAKSLKDKLTPENSAPLSPTVRDLLKDFETESEGSDKEPQTNVAKGLPTVEITDSKSVQDKSKNTRVELPPECNIVNNEPDSTSAIEINSSDNTNTEISNGKGTFCENQDYKSTLESDKTNENVKEMNSSSKKEREKTNYEDAKTNEQNQRGKSYINSTTKNTTESETVETSSNTMDKTLDASKNDVHDKTIPNTGNGTQNSADSLIPNNQEALETNKITVESDSVKHGDITDQSELSLKTSRKRSSSRDSKNDKIQKVGENKLKEKDTSMPVTNIEKTSKQENAAKLIKSTELTKQTIDETSNSNKCQQGDVSKTVSDNDKNNENASASTEKELTSSKIDDQKQDDKAKDINPCLMSVSLFEEQFNNTKYSDSEPEEVKPEQTQNANTETVVGEKKVTGSKSEALEKDLIPEPETEKVNKTIEMKTQPVARPIETSGTEKNLQETIKNKEAEVQKKDTKVTALENADTDILDSGSDRESKTEVASNNTTHASTTVNLKRERALANVFGFATGVPASSSRKRRTSHKRTYHYKRHRTLSPDSSEWSSDSDCEYISPPSRRSKPKKYLKPYKSRILQDPDENMLYVIIGNKVYPLINQEGDKMNFLTYHPEEADSYWKKKYIEEKEKTEEVRKLLKQPQNNTMQVHDLTLPSTSKGGDTILPKKDAVKNDVRKSIDLTAEKQTETNNDKMILKIATKTGLEYSIEGGWNQISNAMPQVMKYLHSETTNSPGQSKAVPNRVSEKNELDMEPGQSKAVPNRVSEKIELDVEPGQSKAVPNRVSEKIELDMEPGQSKAVPNRVSEKIESDMEPGQSKAVPNRVSEIIELDMEEQHEEITPEPEVLEKVDKFETEIFSKIEELAKEDNEDETENVTKRRASKRKNASSTPSLNTSKRPAKRLRSPSSTKSKRVSETKVAEPDENQAKNADVEPPETESKTTVEQPELVEEIEKPKIKGRPKKGKKTDIQDLTKASKSQTNLEENVDSRSLNSKSSQLNKKSDLSGSSKGTVQENKVELRRTSARQHRTPNKYVPDSGLKNGEKPSTPKLRKEAANITEIENNSENIKYMLPTAEASTSRKKSARNLRSMPEINIVPPREEQSNSVDSTSEYLDSDLSLLKIVLPQRKRKISYMARKIVSNRRFTRRKSLPIYLEFSTDSSNSSYFIPHRRSLSIHDSESGSFPSIGTQKKSQIHLERIDEFSPQNDSDDIRHFNSVSNDSLKSNEISGLVLDLGSSSGISLPLSPELSIVENLSISREIIKSDNHPTINEIQQNNRSGPMDYTDFMITNVDITEPLMDQGCKLQKESNVTSKTRNRTEAVLKDCSVNLTLSKSLDQKMRNLLLESAQKAMQGSSKQIPMEVDQTPITTTKKPRARNRKINVDMSVDIDQPKTETSKKTRAKKRSSTPQKKKPAPKSQGPQDAIIEEEHLQSCVSGRRSCPPVVTFLPVDENANNCSDVSLPVPKTKQKKDIIKVKIQRPRDKSGSKSRKNKSAVRGSVCTDSGINETESILVNDDSVDLIHNHSETCLMANECMTQSLEMIENCSTVISLSSSRSQDSISFKLFEDLNVLPDRSICRNNEIAEPIESEDFHSADTVFLSPVMTNNSLITEDLSNSPTEKPSKWYLFEEDMTNQETTSSLGCFGSNLHHIFPLACAVPNLSSISELSRENEDSNKATPDQYI